MNKKVVISIPVHEQPLVVANHLENIRKFVPNSSVILHASGDRPEFQQEIRNICNQFSGFAYVNSTSYRTFAANEAGNVTGLSTVHASNFRFINNIITDFDVFALETSNDMFVRRGVENSFNNFECGCGVIKDSPDNWRNRNERITKIITGMEKFVELKFIEKHAQEGTFYPKKVFKQVSDIILDGMGGFLDSEELIIHTLAYNISPELYENTVGGSYVFHDYRDASTKHEDIHAVRSGSMPNKYAVKRVPRNINDACRNFINNLVKND
jgi:hypothetical protein